MLTIASALHYTKVVAPQSLSSVSLVCCASQCRLKPMDHAALGATPLAAQAQPALRPPATLPSALPPPLPILSLPEILQLNYQHFATPNNTRQLSEPPLDGLASVPLTAVGLARCVARAVVCMRHSLSLSPNCKRSAYHACQLTNLLAAPVQCS